MIDRDWTIVDQKHSPLKPYPDYDDCDENKSYTSANGNLKSGCWTRSDFDGNHKKMTLYFHPYAFDTSGVLPDTTPHSGQTWVYDNNLSRQISVGSTTPAATSIMGVLFQGAVTAMGADGATLTNYTGTCAAKDIELHVDFNSTPSTVKDSGGNTVHMLQVLHTANSQTLSAANSRVYSDINRSDVNMTLSKWNFRNGSNNGSADVYLAMNLEKPFDRTVNVVDINFTGFHAYGVNDIANADQTNLYRPDGNSSYAPNKEIRFYFAKVAPSSNTDGRTIYLPQTSTSTAIRVGVYCEDNTSIGLLCSTLPGLYSMPEESDPIGNGSWYRVTTHKSSWNDGEIVELNSSISNVQMNSLNPLTHIAMDTNGSSSDITIRYDASYTRPAHPRFVIAPDVWLKYDPVTSRDGNPVFTLHFLNSGLKWKGTGRTGHILKTEPVSKPNRRLNW